MSHKAWMYLVTNHPFPHCVNFSRYLHDFSSCPQTNTWQLLRNWRLHLRSTVLKFLSFESLPDTAEKWQFTEGQMPCSEGLSSNRREKRSGRNRLPCSWLGVVVVPGVWPGPGTPGSCHYSLPQPQGATGSTAPGSGCRMCYLRLLVWGMEDWNTKTKNTKKKHK